MNPPIRDDIQRAATTGPSRWSMHTVLIVIAMIVVIVTSLIAAAMSQSIIDSLGVVASIIIGLVLSGGTRPPTG